MPSQTEDTLGCIAMVVALAAGGWWLYNHYEIKKRDHSSPPAAPVSRPSGLIEIATLPNGTVWRLDADSVSGPKLARQAWIKEDHSKEPGNFVREADVLYRINCQTSGFQTLKNIGYDKDGQVVRAWGEEMFGKNVDYAPPSSYIGEAITEACRAGYDSPPSPPPPPPTPVITVVAPK